jgi:hypothetical protein
MKAETPEEKFNRLRDILQNLWLKAYPNPDRIGCPGGRAVENLAKRASDLRDDIEAEPDYEHVTHCSPCDREFLDAREKLRAEEVQAKPGKCTSDQDAPVHHISNCGSKASVQALLP